MVSQGRYSVREYARHVQDLGNSVGDMPDNLLIHFFWDSTQQYICVGWATVGFNPETSTFDELEAAAINIERAEALRQKVSQASPTCKDHTQHVSGSNGNLRMNTHNQHPNNDLQLNLNPKVYDRHSQSTCSDSRLSHGCDSNQCTPKPSDKSHNGEAHTHHMSN